MKVVPEEMPAAGRRPPVAQKPPTTTAAAAKPLPAFLLTIGGRLAMVAAFAALLALTSAVAWPAVSLALVVTSVLPAHRRLVLAIATVGVVLASPPLDLQVLAALSAGHAAESTLAAWPLVVIATLAFGCLCVEFVRRYPKSELARRPVLALFVLLTMLLVVAGGAPLSGAAWFVVTATSMCLGSYLWFFAYAVSETKLRGAPRAIDQLGYWRPFWGFSNVPMGKGAAYLERVEARDAASLAAVQLSGLKLMLWCALLTVVMDALRFAVYVPHGELGGVAGQMLWWLPPQGLPPIAGLLQTQADGVALPLATRWAAMLAEFLMTILHMTTWGNAIVATCRMAGYNAALNTDRPMLSTSVSEFYNRFYYYFKELLATFFFYPTYLQLFRSRPKLRLFAATVMAAGVGNFLFHFYRDSHEIYRLGYWNALVAYRAYACYALILGVAIAISQMRLLAHRRRQPTGARRVLAIAGVLFFYCLLGVLDVRSSHGLGVYAAVYVSLFVP